MNPAEKIELGEYVYGFGAHGGESEACFFARTREARKKKLRARGLVFDETTYKMKSPTGVFFCLEAGHHFRANVERWTDNGKPCPFCSGEQIYPEGNHIPHVDDDFAMVHRERFALQRVPIEEIERRLGIFQCCLADPSKFIRTRDPVDLKCLLCGDIIHSEHGVERVFQACYAIWNINKGDRSRTLTRGGRQPMPFCKKCRRSESVLQNRRRVPRKNKFGYIVTIEVINERVKKWNIECTEFITIRYDKNKWRCNVCGYEWEHAGGMYFYKSAKRVGTPCVKCNTYRTCRKK